MEYIFLKIIIFDTTFIQVKSNLHFKLVSGKSNKNNTNIPLNLYKVIMNINLYVLETVLKILIIFKFYNKHS